MKVSEASALLSAEYKGNDVEFHGATIDTRQLQPGNLFIAFSGVSNDGNAFVQIAKEAGAAAAIVTAYQDCDLPQILVKQPEQALRCLAEANRQTYSLPVVAITGSCGKTTTKNLLASILKGVAPTLASAGTYNNNLGVPWMLMGLDASHRYAVFELGANHKGEVADLVDLVKPSCAVITMVAPVHLEGFGSLDNIAAAKSEIYEGLPADGTAIINADDAFVDYFKSKAGSRPVLTFGQNEGAAILATDIGLSDAQRPCFVLHTPVGSTEIKLQLLGAHNVTNALAAAACAYSLGVGIDAIKQGLEACLPETKRLNIDTGPCGTVIIDDSYNANPSSVAAAIKLLANYQGKKILVLGDMLELADRAEELHRHIGNVAKDHQLDALYGYGPLSDFACQAFRDKGLHFADQASLIESLRAELGAGTTVLVKGSKSMKMWQVVEAIKGGAACSTG